jgi:hypothetical protein
MSRTGEETIRALEQEGRRATLENDLAWHRTNLDEGWKSINANGSMTNRPQLISLLEKSPFSFDSIDDSDVDLRLYDEAIAVVTGISTRRRRDRETVVRFARTYRRTASGWVIILSQQTPVPSQRQ